MMWVPSLIHILPSTISHLPKSIVVEWSFHFLYTVYRRIIIVLNMCSTSWQDRAVFFEMVWLPSRTLRRRASDSDSWNSLLPLMAVKINLRMPANRGTRCARRNSRRLFRQGVTHLLGRHERRQSKNKKATLSTRGSDRSKLLWGHYCVESAAMRTHASKRPTRPPTKARLASVCVDSNSSSEARVEGARSGFFCVTRSCDLIHHIFFFNLKVFIKK